MAMIGGGAIVVKDVPPYMLASGDRAELYGLNIVGLKRKGFTIAGINELKKAYHTIFYSGKTLETALKTIKGRKKKSQEVKNVISFIESSKRGICHSV